jgi:hypothetical protein
MTYLKLKIDDSGTFEDYFDACDIKRIKQRSNTVSILVSDSTGCAWVDLVDMTIDEAFQKICWARNHDPNCE